LKINDSDTLYSFSTLEEAEIKLNELKNSDTNGRDYKVSIKNDDGSFTDL
jgi:hypothetical protein